MDPKMFRSGILFYMKKNMKNFMEKEIFQKIIKANDNHSTNSPIYKISNIGKKM